ncbi:hypothetical protein ACNOYE_02870 [Nannocystaceae bacterium ST9]
MTPRTRRSVDMLPLLDVFMVVLFVFATIQEHELEDSSEALATLERRVEVLEVENQAQRGWIAAAERREQALADQLAAAELEAAKVRDLDEQLAEFRRLCGKATPGGPLCPAIELDPKTVQEQLATDTLLARLFDNVAVFEIELQGEVDLEREVLRNHCCFRSDPPDGAWQDCGELPSALTEQAAWIADGGQGLLDGLRRTRGGNAIVLIRQGGKARYRLTNDLADALREQLPDHGIYDDGEVAELACPLLPR